MTQLKGFMTSNPFLLKNLTLAFLTPVLAANSLQGFAAPPTGLNAAGQLVPAGEFSRVSQTGFAFTKLENGIQIRVSGQTKNVLFYGPQTVRVNTNLGRAH